MMVKYHCFTVSFSEYCSGGYAIDPQGIHHLVPPAPLECDLGQLAYGYLTLYPASEGKNYMDFTWVGKLPIVRPDQWPTRMDFV